MNGKTKIKNLVLDNPLIFVFAVSCLLSGLYIHSSAGCRASRELGRASDLNKALEAETEKLTGELAESRTSLDGVAGRVKEAEREAETVSSGAGTAVGEVEEAGSKLSSAVSDTERAEKIIGRLRETLKQSKKTE